MTVAQFATQAEAEYELQPQRSGDFNVMQWVLKMV